MFALAIINHLIQQNRETQAALAGYNGIVLRINAAGLVLHGRFNAEGFWEESDREADAEITFHQSALQKVLQGQTPGVGDVALDGKARMALMPRSTLVGDANLLVFPNMDAANISYNLLKTAAGGNIAIGPLLLGAAQPVHILTASATVRRIVNMTALTVADANVAR